MAAYTIESFKSERHRQVANLDDLAMIQLRDRVFELIGSYYRVAIKSDWRAAFFISQPDQGLHSVSVNFLDSGLIEFVFYDSPLVAFKQLTYDLPRGLASCHIENFVVSRILRHVPPDTPHEHALEIEVLGPSSTVRNLVLNTSLDCVPVENYVETLPDSQ